MAILPMEVFNMLLKRCLFLILITFVMLMSIPKVSYGNSTEPPSIMIIVPNAPKDLEISIGKDNSFTEGKEIDKVLEKYYVFYSREIKVASKCTLNVKTDNLTYEINFKKPSQTYQNIYTLNLESQTLTPGKSIGRSITLVTMRVTLTLLIEGVVFYLFGFRERRSWLIFLIINLITQGALNIWINGLFPIESYLFFGLMAIEILIVIVEAIVILSSIKEHRKSKVLFVISANFLSLVAGGYILAALPF